MRALILLNGDWSNLSRAAIDRERFDVCICADGGGRAAERLGMRPDLVVGDFDSLTESEGAHLREMGASILRLPALKDETDFEACVVAAMQQGALETVVAGAFGGRADHFLGNLLLCAKSAFRDVSFKFIDDSTDIFFLRGPGTIELSGTIGDTVSIVPLTDLTGVTIKGTFWPLERSNVCLGGSLTLSNQLTSSTARITAEEGFGFVVHLMINKGAVRVQGAR